MIRLLILLVAASTWASAQDGIELWAAVTEESGGDTEGLRQTQRRDLEVWVGERIVAFEPGDIRTVGLEVENEDATAVAVWLTNPAARMLAGVTSDATGQALAVKHRGSVLSAPLVQGAVTNGLIMIVGLNPAEARRIAQSLREVIGVEDVVEPERTIEPERPASRPSPRPEPVRAHPVGADPVEGAAPQSAGEVASAFVRAVGRRQWSRVADLLHPDSWAAVRPDAVAMLRFEGQTVRVQDGEARGQFSARDVLGRGLTERRPADLSDRDLTALQLAGLDALGVWGPPRAPRDVVGEIEDGDRHHVILQAPDTADGVSNLSAVTVVRDRDGRWRVLFTEARGF